MIQSPPKYFFNNIQFNPSYYNTSSVSQIDLSKKINRGGDEMIGNLSLGNKYINNLASPITALQAVNKTYCDSAIATAGGAFLPLSGGSMSGSINLNNYSITNVASVGNSTQLDLQIDSSPILQLQSNQSFIKVPLIFSLASGGVGINLNGSYIISCGSIYGYNNTNLVLNYYNGVVVSPKISITSGRTLITDGLKISNIGIDMSGNSITNLPAGVDNTDCVNKLQMNDEDNLRVLKGGDTMGGNLNFNSLYGLTNIPSIQSASSLIFKIGIQPNMEIQSTQILARLPITINLPALADGIAMNNTKILSCNSIAGNLNTDLILNYVSASAILPKMTLKSGATLITDGLKMNNTGIDMSGNSITNLPAGSSNTDCVNKQQMDNADNLRLLKGGDTMSGGLNMGGFIITNLPYPSSNTTDAINRNYCDTEDNKRLRLDGSSSMTGNINCNGNNITNIGNLQSQINSNLNLQIGSTIALQLQPTQASLSLLLNMNSNNITNVSSVSSPLNTNFIMNYWGTSVIPKITITSSRTLFTDGLKISNVGIDMSGNTITNLSNGSSALDAVNKSQLDLKLNLTGGTLSNTLTFSGGELNMAGNNITNTSNIHSNGTNPIYLTNNGVAKVKIDSSGITMQNSGNIDMAGMSIFNVNTINSYNLNSIYLTNNGVGKVKVDASGITMLNSGNIDMAGNNITNINTIHSNGINPIYLTNNGVSITQIDGTGIVMSSSKNINMNGNNITNVSNSIASGDAVNRSEIATSSIPLTAWRSGEIVKTKIITSSINSSGVYINSTLYYPDGTIGCVDAYDNPAIYQVNTIIGFSYTPITTSSILSIDIMFNYTINGGGSDNFQTYLFESSQGPTPPTTGTPYGGTIKGNTIQHNRGDGGLRSGTLMPMSFYFNANTTNSLKYYYVCINILSPTGVHYTDDNVSFIGGTQQIKITEIKI